MIHDQDDRLADCAVNAALDAIAASLPGDYPREHVGAVVVAHIGTTKGYAAGGFALGTPGGNAAVARFLRDAADQIDPARQ